MKNSALEREISDYNNLMLKKNRFMENGSEKSPAVVDVSNALNEMKRSIIRSIDDLIKTLNLQISGMKNREVDANEKIAGVPTKEMIIAGLERRAKIQEKLYLYLLQKREENELGGAMTVSNYKIVDEAEGSFIPVSPRKYRLLFIALVLGFLLPLAFLYFKEMFDTSIKYLQDVTNNLSIPFLGTIPQVSNGKRRLIMRKKSQEKNDFIVIKNGKQDAINEAFRIVRTNIDAITAKDSDKKVIMLTSFNERAGKSFVAMNLAISFALAKKNTILIDLNLRNATLSSSSRTGISDYLSDRVSSIEEIITQKSDVDFISAGTLPDNPVELLASDDKLKNLITELRKKYDSIVIDTTAFDSVADANIVERVSDITLFVVRERMSDIRKFSELETVYKNNKLKNMMIVMNGME
jgi:capsular exopolysaccharide synthesis family protein